jgi:hypothetical protein
MATGMDVPRSDRSDLERGRLTRNFIDYKRADERITRATARRTRARFGCLRRRRSRFDVTALFPRWDAANLEKERYRTIRQCQWTAKHPLAFRRRGIAGKRDEFPCFGIE